MNNDVSKNTFSVNFFKLQNIKQNPIAKSLTQNLRQAIDLYWQSKDIANDLKLIHNLLDRKIILLLAPSSKIVYQCTVAFPLAKYVDLSPTIVARELVALFLVAFRQSKASWQFKVTITAGQIDFWWQDLALACWLNWAIARSKICQSEQNALLAEINSMPSHLFPVQYAHARCCSWLRLAEREDLLVLRKPTDSMPIWQITQPNSIDWFDAANNFYLTHPSEYRLLFGLIQTLAESSNETNWLKIALYLSEAMLAFEAECQIFGEIKQKHPQHVIARLSLLALVQYCLQKLLNNKFKVVALTEL